MFCEHRLWDPAHMEKCGLARYRCAKRVRRKDYAGNYQCLGDENLFILIRWMFVHVQCDLEYIDDVAFDSIRLMSKYLNF